MVWILGGDAEGRQKRIKQSDCSRCEEQLKGISLVSSGGTGHCPHRLYFLSVPFVFTPSKVTLFFLGPLPVFNFVSTFSSGNSPHPARCPKPPGKICGTKSYCSWTSKTMNSITTCFHISSTSENSTDESAVIYTSSELHSCRRPPGLLYHCSYKQTIKQSVSIWLSYYVDGWRVIRVHSMGAMEVSSGETSEHLSGLSLISRKCS